LTLEGERESADVNPPVFDEGARRTRSDGTGERCVGDCYDGVKGS